MSVRRSFLILLSTATLGAGLLQTVPAAAVGAAVRPTLTITTIASGLNLPWDIAQTPDGTLLFDQRLGELDVRLTDGTVRKLTADLGDLFAQGETGMMGLVLDPAFSANRRFYTCQGRQVSGAKSIQVVAWTVNLGYTKATRVANPLLGGIPANQDTGRHGGCRLRFDTTGALMIGTGDNALGSNPQDITSLAGKVLRINAQTGAPAAGNPALGAANPITRLIYNYGHRNVQGLALRASGQMFNVEQGTSIEDEVNLVLPRRNYGWDPEGVDGSYDESAPMTDLVKFPNAVPASWSSGPTDATCGGTFVNGTQWKSWNGSLMVGELQGEALLRLTFDSAGRLTSEEQVPEFSNVYGRIRTAQMGTDGALYLTTSNGTDVPGTDIILKVTAS